MQQFFKNIFFRKNLVLFSVGEQQPYIIRQISNIILLIDVNYLAVIQILARKQKRISGLLLCFMSLSSPITEVVFPLLCLCFFPSGAAWNSLGTGTVDIATGRGCYGPPTPHYIFLLILQIGC